ncbi:polycomb complex protein BMI-1-B-like [Amphibalanus amphitrite]|uniref:polycomb complex protein BMI-1-B-like n=1 Tax=Amphibalanus amphitrite TaxID=1232801 RepID=UPI001C8FC582|nr:polycomb complex protein BMI-1-B-like [Amphibalanus amphitrite]
MENGEQRNTGAGAMASAVVDPAERPGGRPRLGDLRSHITCVLCAGYFIDATTIVECLHTFCRSCILCHLESSSCCPVCAGTIHRTKGSSSLRADATLQTLVYKMVPDLFSQEMQQRRDFYEEKPYAGEFLSHTHTYVYPVIQ